MVLFLLGAARDVDQRTGSALADPIESEITQRSPLLGLSIGIERLHAQVSVLLSGLREQP